MIYIIYYIYLTRCVLLKIQLCLWTLWQPIYFCRECRCPYSSWVVRGSFWETCLWPLPTGWILPIFAGWMCTHPVCDIVGCQRVREKQGCWPPTLGAWPRWQELTVNLEMCQHALFPVYFAATPRYLYICIYIIWLYIYKHMLMFCYICPHATAINYMKCSSLGIMTCSIYQASVNHHELVQETRRCIQTFQKLKSQEATTARLGTTVGVPKSRGTLWWECGR